MKSVLTDTWENAASFWSCSNGIQKDTECPKFTPVSRISIDDPVELSIVFLRDYVAKNKLCIIENLQEVKEWSVFSQFEDLTSFQTYLQDKTSAVKVNVTPNGLADAVTPVKLKDGIQTTVFMKPLVQTIVSLVLSNFSCHLISSFVYIT